MFSDEVSRLASEHKLHRLLKDLTELLHRRQWKWKLVVFNDDGEEWELAPNVLSIGPRFTSKQTKRQTIEVECEVRTP